MANSGQYNAFLQGFMDGYGFIDNIYSKKRAEARLDQRLQEERDYRDFQRNRITSLDQQQQIDRERRRKAEDKLISRQEEYDAANEALAGIQPGDYEGGVAALSPWAHLPEVQAKISELRQFQQQEADDRMLAGGGGLVGGAAQVAGAGAGGGAGGVAPDAAAGQPAPVGAPVAQPKVQPDGSTVYPGAAALPQDPVDAANRRYSKAELEAIAATDPKAAAELRDQQQALDRMTTVPIEDPSDPEAVSRLTSPRMQQTKKARRSRDLTRNIWDAALNINDSSGDTFRNLPARMQVGQYYRDRSQLTADQQAEADRLLAPKIDQTIEEQKAILADPNLDPNSMEARSARRKLNESYGLINARQNYKPLEAANVNESGLPINGRNEQLTNQVLENSRNQPGPNAPGTPTQVAAENRVLERGAQNGRVTGAFASAAWRKYKRGEIDWTAYQSLIQTGRMPSSAETTLEQFDPKDGPVWAITKGADGSLTWKKIIEGQEDYKTQAEKLRNLIQGDAKDQIDALGADLAAAMGKEGKGSDYTTEFFAMLGQHEATARARGYDYGNLADISQLWMRYKDLNMLSQAIEGELVFKGQLNTDFQNAYGMSVADALFTPFDQGDLSELEVPGSTTLGMGGDPVNVRGLRGVDQGFLEAVRREYPQYSELSNQELEQILIANGVL